MGGNGNGNGKGTGNGQMQLATTAVVGAGGGAPVIETGSPLTRLNYFDGKLLRAQDLDLEQRYLRNLVALSNQAGGAGVVDGYDVSLGGGDTLALGPGMAMDAAGRVLLLSQAETFSIAKLIEQGRALGGGTAPVPTPAAGAAFADCVPATAALTSVSAPSDLYLVCLGHAEDFCGQEDVYGSVCDPACAKSSQRPYVVEGIVVLVRPLGLALPLPPRAPVAIGRVHLRSRVASAYFAREAAEIGSLLSAAGLRSGIFCLGSDLAGGACVPIAVLDRAGGVSTFLDPWIARRERIEAPARRYWAWRMSMRPWDVFLAQVLQFQCQLPGVLACAGGGATDPGGDPCATKTQVIGEVADAVKQARDYLAGVATQLANVVLAQDVRAGLQLDKVGQWVSGYEALAQKITDARQPPRAADRLLIRCGLVELPSACYLPIDPTSTVPVEQQVRDLVGEGVDLRFCAARADYVPRAFESAQHMERISLLDGLADPNHLPKVDVVVPDGEVVTGPPPTNGKAFDATLLTGAVRALLAAAASEVPVLGHGAARTEVLAGGGGAFYFAGVGAAAPNTGGTNVGPAAGTVVAAPAGIDAVAEASRKLVMHRLATRPLADDKPYETRLDGLSTKLVPSAVSSAVRATWITLRVDSNPMSLGARGATACSGRFSMVIPTAKPVLEETVFSGELRVLDTAVTTATVVHGVLQGRLDRRVTTGGQTQHQVNNVAVPITIAGSGDATAGKVDVTLPINAAVAGASKAGATLSGGAAWKGVPTQALGQIAVTVGVDTTAGEHMNLAEDPAVLNAGDARHTLALQALDVLDAVLDEPGFRASAEQALFPPVSKVPVTRVRPTRDWVLLHRRRESSCDCCATTVAPPAVRPRAYRLYVGQVASSAEAAAVREALLNNDPGGITKGAFREAGLVQTDGSGTALLTPGDALLAELASVPHRDGTFYAAIAGAGDAANDGQNLSLGRLAAVEAALASVLSSTATGRLPPEVLGVVPAPTLSAANADGVIVLVTAPVNVVSTGTKARVVVLDGQGQRAKLPDGNPAPDMVLTETASAVTVDNTSAAVLKKLFSAAPRPALQLELVLPTGASSDANASARLKSAFDALAKIGGVVAADTKMQIRTALAADQPIFTEANVTVNELLGLRMAGG